MAAPQFIRVALEGAAARAQDTMGRCLDWLLACDDLDGVIVANVALASGVTTVAHKLGRKPAALFVRSKTAAGEVWMDHTASTTNERTCVVHAGADMTATLRFS